jgi:polyisoprenoid-binding protein YceI
VWLCVPALLFLFASPPTFASDYPAPGVFDVVGGESELRVLVYPAGLFGGLGHSHVISTSNIAGRIEISGDPAGSNVELTIPVESLEVDNQALRDEEGEEFRKTVPDKDKRGTRKNMLGKKLLDSRNFSTISVRSNTWSGDLPNVIVSAEFTVRDQRNSLEFPVSVDASDDVVVVFGSLTVSHEQLGLKPFRAGLGSLRVRDEMEIRFRITARRVGD